MTCITRSPYRLFALRYTQDMDIDLFLFDLDDTLYPSSAGIWAAIRQRMEQYMRERLNLPAEKIPELRRQFFETYGTTMRGLQQHYALDVPEYLAYVHDVPVEDVLKPAPELRELLSMIPVRKIILTNADVNHANRVLKALEIQGCFDQIIDILQIAPYCKPQTEAFQRALELAGNVDPCRCVLLEDSNRNLASAKSLGMTTLWVGHDQSDPVADYFLPDILALKHLLPRLLNGKYSK